MDLSIPQLGAPRRRSPLHLSTARGDRVCNFVSDDERVLYHAAVGGPEATNGDLSFERAGPRARIFFDPAELRAGMVTCGGLCPGTNSVIRAATMELWFRYGVRSITGFRYGFAGLVPTSGDAPIPLDPDVVNDIHHHGGSILSSSRGAQDTAAMVDTLARLGIGMLIVVGGDGTMRGAHALYEEVGRRGLRISIVAVPKTIDNDIYFVERTFGFETAFSIAVEAIRSAHVESKGYVNGVGLVKLMGRYSGSIAAHAALAEPDVNLVLVPEVPFVLDGEKGLVAWLVDRLSMRRHAVIVVAEGAGQELIAEDGPVAERDASGNVRLRDIGTFLRERLARELEARRIPHALKYIDPSYMIRSAPAYPNDAIYSADLARAAVHAGMSGRTGLLVGSWNAHLTHVPLGAVLDRRNTLDPESDLWLAVLESTGQPAAWT
jgi:6-phosphofructokinase 1